MEPLEVISIQCENHKTVPVKCIVSPSDVKWVVSRTANMVTYVYVSGSMFHYITDRDGELLLFF